MTTNNPSKTAATFSFCVVADPHCSEKVGAHMHHLGLEHHGDAIDKFFACLNEMEELAGGEKPDFILVLGDVHVTALEQHLHRIKIPLHLVAGNHEGQADRKRMRDLFAADFLRDGQEADYYSLVHKGVRFIGLCNARENDHSGTFCSEDIRPRGQCEWLEKELSQPETQKIIFAHVPPHPDGQDEFLYLSRNDSRYFNQLVEQTQPTAMFFGHLHEPTEQRQVGRTQSFIVRSCCWNFNKVPVGFLMVKVSAAGIAAREILTGSYE